MAPSYLSAVVAVAIGAQHMLGLQFTPEEWNAAILVVCGLVVALRQVLTGRATWYGGRK